MRLHRVVLLHITWEGKKAHFFVPITTFYQTQQCASTAVISKKKLLQIEIVQAEFLSEVSSHGSVQQMKGGHICFGKTEASPSPTASHGASSLVCFLLLFTLPSSLPHCSLKRRKRREEKVANILLSRGHALEALEKTASQQMQRDMTTLPMNGFGSFPEFWDLTFYGDLSSHPHFQGGFRSSRLSSNSSHVSSFELF